MFEFVVGLLASPFIAYLVYVYAAIGSRIMKTALGDTNKPLRQKAISAVLAALIVLVPMLLVIPLLSHPSLVSGLFVGCFFVFLFTRKPRSVD